MRVLAALVMKGKAMELQLPEEMAAKFWKAQMTRLQKFKALSTSIRDIFERPQFDTLLIPVVYVLDPKRVNFQAKGFFPLNEFVR